MQKKENVAVTFNITLLYFQEDQSFSYLVIAIIKKPSTYIPRPWNKEHVYKIIA